MSSSTPRVNITFANGNLLKNIPAIDGFAGIVCTGQATAVWPLNVPKSINSLKELEDLQVFEEPTEAVVGTAASSGFSVTNPGDDGDTIDIKVDGVRICGADPIAKTGNEADADDLAQKIRDAINDNTSTNGGFTADGAAAGVIIYAPLSLGDTINGLEVEVNIDGGIELSQYNLVLSGGVTQLSASDNTLLYKTVKEFYQELGGNQELFIMMMDEYMSTMLDSTWDDGANKLVEFAEGKLAILGVIHGVDYIGGHDFLDVDVEDAILAAKSFVQRHNNNLKFLRVLIAGTIASEDATGIFAPNTASNGFVGVVLGDTVSGQGAAIGVALGRRQKYACHIKLGKVANGPLVTPSIYIGTKKLKDVTNLQNLHGRGFISFVTYPQKAGFYFGIDNMASDDDYRILVHGQVIDAAAKVAASVYIDELEGEVDTNPDGTITDLDAKHLEDRVEQQAQVTLGDRISGIEAIVDRTVNIINTSTTKIKIRVRPKGYNTFIEVDLGLTAGTA